jgi:hypothetical protein
MADNSTGDVNGDGLDDLIIGAHHANPSGEKKAGKSYVVFGKQAVAIDITCTGD